jgi:heme/copper-type cytochrome/quinol oxidase subunit 2
MRSRLLLIAMCAGFACVCGALVYVVADHEAGEPDLRIKAVAHQWWWEFDYPSLGVRTSDVLYLPSAKDVRLELSSANVIHSFWILGMKVPIDIIPGKVRSVDLLLTSPGDLYGNCDSGCGCGTVCMRFRVLAKPPAQFQRWATAERLKPTAFRRPPQLAALACASTRRAIITRLTIHPTHSCSGCLLEAKSVRDPQHLKAEAPKNRGPTQQLENQPRDANGEQTL